MIITPKLHVPRFVSAGDNNKEHAETDIVTCMVISRHTSAQEIGTCTYEQEPMLFANNDNKAIKKNLC